MHGRGCKQHIFRSHDIYFQCMCFDEDPFTCQCKKEDRNSKGFHILHFYWSFSSDIMAVKGLSTKRLYGLLGLGSPGWLPQLLHSSWVLSGCCGRFLAFILSGWNMSGHCSWFLAFILSGWISTTLWLGFGLYIIKLKYEWTLWLILGLCIIKFKHTYTHTCTHSHTYTFHLPCAWIYQIWPLSLCPTWITPIVVRECLEELLGSVWEAAEEDCAQTANVQSGGPFKLQLPDVVADDGTAVLQKQLAGLKQTT